MSGQLRYRSLSQCAAFLSAEFLRWSKPSLYLPCRIADQVFREGESVRFSGKIPAAFASILLWITGTRSMSLIFDNKKITLAAALFLCFCPYFVMSGRYALDCNLMLCCISCSVLVLLLYLKTGKLHTLLLSGVCFGISLYSYALSYLIIPIFLVLISLYMLYHKKNHVFQNTVVGGQCLHYGIARDPFLPTHFSSMQSLFIFSALQFLLFPATAWMKFLFPHWVQICGTTLRSL
ncbi:MAG: glycosyltransferase family 39 protein [Waltera sp.]